MSEQKLHADGYFVFETEYGIIGRTVATFTRAEDAAEYVKQKADRDRLRAALEEIKKHNRLHHDLDAYLYHLAEWGLGETDERPDLADFGLLAP